MSKTTQRPSIKAKDKTPSQSKTVLVAARLLIDWLMEVGSQKKDDLKTIDTEGVEKKHDGH